MKKRLLVVVLLVLLCHSILGCESEQSQVNTQMLELPGFPWGCTPEYVRSEAGLRDEQVLEDAAVSSNDETWESWVIVAEGMECYGAAVSSIQFRFGRRAGGEYGLERVEIFFPEGTDMAQIVQNMEKLYGPGSTEKPVHYILQDGGLLARESTQIQQSDPEERDETPWAQYWISGKDGTQCLSASAQERMIEYYSIQSKYAVSEEVMVEFLKREPQVTAICTNATLKGALNRGESKYVSHYGVILDARQMNWLLQNFESPAK